MEAFDLPNVLSSFDHEVILTVAENSCPYIRILNFRLDFNRCPLCSLDIPDEVVVEDEFSGVSVVFVLVLWNYAALLVDLEVLPVDVESRETSLVALFLLSVVLGTDDLLKILLKSLIEGNFHSCKRILRLVIDNAVSASVSLYLLLGVCLLGDRLIDLADICLFEEGN